MSSAKPLAVSNRRLRSFSRAFITIQSRSPRTSWLSLRGSVFLKAAIEANEDPWGGLCPQDVEWEAPLAVSWWAEPALHRLLSLVLGLGGSSSRIIRRISSNAADFSRSLSNGVVPVSSSYNRTPSE